MHCLYGQYIIAEGCKMKVTNYRKPTVISLFSGAGGMDLGFIFSGYDIIWANEIDPYACTTYKNNIGRHIVNMDVKDVQDNNVPNADVIIGGFPCQDFSVLGGAKRKGILVKRGQLYRHFLRLVKSKKPKVFLAENVKGIKSANKGLALKLIVRDFERLESVDINKLDELVPEEFVNENFYKANSLPFYDKSRSLRNTHYDVKVVNVNFANFGVPQVRQRILIVGIRSDINAEFEPPKPFLQSKEYVSSGEVMCGKVIYCSLVEKVKFNNEPPRMAQRTVEMLKSIPEGGNYKDLHGDLKVKGLMSNIYKRLDRNKPAYTVIANGGGGTWGYHYEHPRTLTNRERARLQTFPDWFQFHGSVGKVRTQIGNAVPPLGIMPFAFALKSFFIEGYSSSTDPYLIGYNSFVERLINLKQGKIKGKVALEKFCK